VEGNDCGTSFKTLPHNLPGGTVENHENMWQPVSGPDLNPEPLEYEAGLLTTRWKRPVLGVDGTIILKQISKKHGVNWIHLAQDTAQ
jgi:hypothetical protein